MLHSKSKSVIVSHDNINLKKEHHIKMKKLMFEIQNENDLTLNITNILNELVETNISSFANNKNVFVKYDHFKLISDIVIKFKELLLVAMLKLKELKIFNIHSHSLITHLKSNLEFMELSIHEFIKSLENVTDEHFIAFSHILKMLSNMKNDEFLQK